MTIHGGSDKYYNPTNKIVYDGDTAQAADLNSVNNAVDAAFEEIANDLDTLEANTINWSTYAKAWADSDPGVEPDPLYPSQYSARAQAEEAAGWASALAPWVLADGTASTEISARAERILAETAKTNADASAAAALVSEGLANEWAESAVEVEPGEYSSKYWALITEAYKDIAIGSHTISTSGENIVVTPVGLDYAVTHDTVGLSDGTFPAVPANNNVVVSIEKDANGHIIGATVNDHDLRYLGITAKAADSDLLDGQTGAYYETAGTCLPLAGGTMVGSILMDGSLGYMLKDATGASYLDLRSTYYAIYTNSGDESTIHTVNGYFVDFATMATPKGVYLREGAVTKGTFTANTAGDVTTSAYGNYRINCVGGGSVELWQDGYNAFQPTTNNTIILGHSTLRWNKLWTQNIDTVNAVVVSSDERLKNIKTLKAGDADWLYNVTPIEFTWKNGSGFEDDATHFGFSAQEVEANVPDKKSFLARKKLKKKDKKNDPDDFTWGLAPTEMISPMLQLIKEQKAQIDDLTNRIAALEVV